MTRDTPVLLYDGECGFCASSVQFALRHESPARASSLRFAPLQGAFGTVVRAEHPEVATIGSVLWYEPGPKGASRVLARSDAALAVVAHLGGAWRMLALCARAVPRAVRDAVYDLVARRRFELAARACLLPTADQRQRFLM